MLKTYLSPQLPRSRGAPAPNRSAAIGSGARVGFVVPIRVLILVLSLVAVVAVGVAGDVSSKRSTFAAALGGGVVDGSGGGFRRCLFDCLANSSGRWLFPFELTR